MTNNPSPQEINLAGGITREEVWGECAGPNEFGNFGLKFSCGENSVILYQSESGFLTCDGKEYEIHVAIASGIKELNCTKENPCPTDMCTPIYSFYILKK
jgi:hypothetical protein